MLGYRPGEFPGRAVLEALGAGQEADPSDVFAFAALRPADERDGELWLTGRPRRGEDDQEARGLLERCDDIEVDGLRFTLSDLGRGEAILRVSGGADDRVTDSDAFFRDWYPVLRPQPVEPEAERTARAADGWTREALRRLEGERFNVITLKWWGRPREAPTFAERHGVSGTFIAASRFMHGLATRRRARAAGGGRDRRPHDGPQPAGRGGPRAAGRRRHVRLLPPEGNGRGRPHQGSCDQAADDRGARRSRRRATRPRVPRRRVRHRRPRDAGLSGRDPLGRSRAAAAGGTEVSAPTGSPRSASWTALQASSASCEALT